MNALSCKKFLSVQLSSVNKIVLSVCSPSELAAPALQTNFCFVYYLSNLIKQKAPGNENKSYPLFNQFLAPFIMDIINPNDCLSIALNYSWKEKRNFFRRQINLEKLI